MSLGGDLSSCHPHGSVPASQTSLLYPGSHPTSRPSLMGQRDFSLLRKECFCKDLRKGSLLGSFKYHLAAALFPSPSITTPSFCVRQGSRGRREPALDLPSGGFWDCGKGQWETSFSISTTLNVERWNSTHKFIQRIEFTT